jgi:hypothetical protein
MENITIRLAPGLYGQFRMRDRPGSIEPTDNAAFGVQPQGWGGESIGGKMPGRPSIEPTHL